MIITEQPKKEKPFRIGVLVQRPSAKGSSKPDKVMVRSLTSAQKKRMAKAVKPFRELANISLDELAEDTGLSKGVIADIEEGAAPVGLTDLYSLIRAIAPPNGNDFLMWLNLWFYEEKDVKPIEPKILPLVEALNATKILTTFSSCQGHYAARDQTLNDRNFADVRFTKRPEIPESRIEALLCHIQRCYPRDEAVSVEACKKIIPAETYSHREQEFREKYFPGKQSNTEDSHCYVMIIKPKDRFWRPGFKRKVTDEGIVEITNIVFKGIENKSW